MNGENMLIWKKALVAYFKVVARQFTWRDWRKPGKTCQDNR